MLPVWRQYHIVFLGLKVAWNKNLGMQIPLLSLYGDMSCKVQLWLFDGKINNSLLLIILESWMKKII